MSASEILTEDSVAVRAEAFVEVSYDDAIPNTVDLS